jgi:hypothetical protein
MGWGDALLTRFSDGSTDWWFAPNELVFAGEFEREKNQVVQTAEGGQVKVLDLAEDEVRLFRFRVNKMPFGQRVVGSRTLRGASQLEALIRTTLNYRANTIDMWYPGLTKTSVFAITVRFWGANFSLPRAAEYKQSQTLFGSGREELIFREEIT